MTRSLRRAIGVAGLLAVGALANLVFGVSPRESVAPRSPDDDWRVPVAYVPALDRLDAAWSARTPWGAPPRPREQDAAPPPPPPAPVGIVRGAQGPVAIFLAAGETVKLAIGDPLPGGGKLTSVRGMRVAWIDAEGREQQREMFIDPPPAAVGASAPLQIAPTVPSDASRPAASRAARSGRAGREPGASVSPPPPGSASGSRRQAPRPPTSDDGGGARGPAADAGTTPDAGGGTVTTVSAKSLRRQSAAGAETPPERAERSPSGTRRSAGEQPQGPRPPLDSGPRR